MTAPINFQNPNCQCNRADRTGLHRRSVHSTTCAHLIMAQSNQQIKHKRQDSGLTFALQALLDRHEAYVKESQAEQARLSNYVTDLENEKTYLQDTNHKFVVENRELLQKLEQLNTDFSESGKKVQDLENLLQDCEQEIRRLNGLTRQAQNLETKVLDMERERAELSRHLSDGREETRSTIARWKESEKKVRELEQEVQRIEWAAKVDREKHEEIVARMERDRTLDRELGLSEGRLKATAAVQNLKSSGPREKQVVSNFVRDILQDNANLQAGIAELRELLQSSNDEVQNLREQVILHQPVHDDDTHVQQRSLSLGDELALSRSPPKPVSQEVHVHHHYHAKVGSKKEKIPVTRRSSRRKALMPSAFSSSPSTSGASTPLVRAQRFNSDSEVAPIVRTKDARANRWSMQSTATTSTYMSSMASSPRSYFDRNSSIFDRIEREEESSRPTSPDSFTVSSPSPFKRKARPDEQALSVFEEEEYNDESGPSLLPADISEDIPSLSTNTMRQVTSGKKEDTDEIPELELTPRPSMYGGEVAGPEQPSNLTENSFPEQPLPPEESPSTPRPPETLRVVEPSKFPEPPQAMQLDYVEPKELSYQVPEIRPSIRRRNSHDSLVSISGMDIHLVQNNNARSALALLHGGDAKKHHFAPNPSSARKVSATRPLASVTEFTAISRPGVDNTPSASMMALSGIRNADTHLTTPTKGLIGSVGGWVRGRWGMAPTKSVADLRSSASTSSSTIRTLTASPTSPQHHRPSVNHAATTPAILKSSALSQRSVDTTSTGTSNSSLPNGTTTKPSLGTAKLLDIPKPATRSITIAHRDVQDTASSALASSFFGGRTPGINQSGPIPGFAAAVAAKRAPTEIEAVRVDVEGLKDGLGR